VAALVGQNAFEQAGDAFEKVFIRCHKQKYDAIKKGVFEDLEIVVKSTEETQAQVLADVGATPIIAEMLKTVDAEDTVTTLKEKTTKLQKQLDTVLEGQTPATVRLVREQAVSAVNTEYGTDAELATVKDMKQQFNVKVVKDDTFHHRSFGHAALSGKEWCIGGRTDGFSNGKLVEIKNRVKKLMFPLPIYDVIQFQCYLHVLELEEGQLVQRLKDLSGNRRKVAAAGGQMHTHDIAIDKEYFQTHVLAELQLITDGMEYLITNKEASFEFFALKRGADKTNFLKTKLFPKLLEAEL
jgi:hypothetical protein